MKRTTLIALVGGLLLGCAPAADEAPVGSTPPVDVDVSLPGDDAASADEAETTLVTLEVPGMT